MYTKLFHSQSRQISYVGATTPVLCYCWLICGCGSSLANYPVHVNKDICADRKVKLRYIFTAGTILETQQPYLFYMRC